METRTIHSKVLIYTLLTVLAVLVVVPFFWMLLASVKTSNEVFSIPMKLFPKEFQWVNYQTIWDKIPLLTFQFALISRMGLTDSHLGLILMQAFSGFGVFLIRQFMIGVPNELLEAARIDGLSEYGIFA